MNAELTPDERAAAVALLDMGTLAHMEFEEELPCEMPHHAESLAGCNAARPASHYIEFTHGLGRDDPCAPAVVVVCLEKAVAIRQAAEHRAECPKCKAVATLSDFVRVLGTISSLTR